MSQQRAPGGQRTQQQEDDSDEHQTSGPFARGQRRQRVYPEEPQTAHDACAGAAQRMFGQRGFPNLIGYHWRVR